MIPNSQVFSLNINEARHHFVIKVGGRRYGGRRGISPIFRRGLRSSFWSSYICAVDLSYEIISITRRNTDFSLVIVPIAKKFSTTLFESIVNEKDIHIDWLSKNDCGLSVDKKWPTDGDVVKRDLPSERLDNDEIYYRSYVIEFLKAVGFSEGNIYDPACSTGRCLFDLKNSFPKTTVVGSDRDPIMVAMSRDLGISTFVADANDSRRLTQRADVIIVRFLNLEVVTCQEADSIFCNLVNLVNPNGYLIMWGHTPMHISSNHPAVLALRLLRTTGCTPDHKTMFSFFAWKKVYSDERS
jgi:hypothetical protein